MQLGPSHPTLAWAVRHAWLLTRCQVKSSGKTAHCALYGREYSFEIGLFGETLFNKFCGTQGELLPRWEEGVHVGISELTGENLRSSCFSNDLYACSKWTLVQRQDPTDGQNS